MSRPPWRPRALVVTAVVGLALVGASTLVAAVPSGAVGEVHGFYLALGGSESLGLQPTADSPHGQPTSEGYANDLVAYEAARSVTLDLTQLGCPGETTDTMISGDDHCYDGSGSQLQSAVAFLLAHRGEPGVVTIDLGFNNVLRCLRHRAVGNNCITSHLAQADGELADIVQTLQEAAGPQVTFVGLDHYDPFVVDETKGESAADFAEQSEEVIAQLNATINAVYTYAGVPVAKVSDAFQMDDHDLVIAPDGSSEPVNVVRVCEWTWMCASPPEGHNFHPNAEGYDAIASAIEAVLPAPW